MIDKRLKYKAGQRVGFRGGGMDAGNQSNQDQSAGMGGGGGGGGDGDSNRENYRSKQYTTGPKTRTKTVETSRLNPVTGKKIPSYTIETPFSPKSKTGFGRKGEDTFHEAQIKNMKKSLKEVNPGFFDSGLGKIIKTIGLGIIAPQLLAGTKLGGLYSGYNKAKQVAALASKFNITDKNVATSLTDTVKDKFAGFSTTGTKGPKGPPREEGDGGEPNQQNALMSEYLLLLQKMEQGVLQGEEQGRFNSLKSRLGKAQGGIMNVNINKGQLDPAIMEMISRLYT